jgi:small subunit ribosomal protein S2
VDENDNPVPGFADQLPDTSALKPDLVVCLNPRENYILLHECGLHNIPTIGIIDTDTNPSWVTYPIPANDDSLRSVQVICGALGRAGEEGQAMRRAKARRNIVVSMPSHGLQPPKEGQVEKELEEKRLEAVRKREEDELWARIAQEVPGGVVEKREAKQLEIDEGALENLDATVGMSDATPAVRNLNESDMMEAVNDAEFDVPLNQPPAEYDSVPYECDSPLTEQELAQAPPADDRLDDFGGELDAQEEPEYFGGIRDERDPK